jgi:hypothetical protein
MSQRAGKKPLTTGHVDRLSGSMRAKDRMRVFLETLRGTLTVVDACQLLEVSEAQFHHLRHTWLQESLELLEPRPVGRPPNPVDPSELSSQCSQLQAEVARLRTELQGVQVREEVARILADPTGDPAKKKEVPTPHAKPR